MSPRLPVCKSRQVLEALKKAGREVAHVRRSHHQLRHSGKPGKRITVPIHPGDLPRFILHKILRQAEISVEEFRNLL